MPTFFAFKITPVSSTCFVLQFLFCELMMSHLYWGYISTLKRIRSIWCEDIVLWYLGRVGIACLPLDRIPLLVKTIVNRSNRMGILIERRHLWNRCQVSLSDVSCSREQERDEQRVTSVYSVTDDGKPARNTQNESGQKLEKFLGDYQSDCSDIISTKSYEPTTERSIFNFVKVLQINRLSSVTKNDIARGLFLFVEC